MTEGAFQIEAEANSITIDYEPGRHPTEAKEYDSIAHAVVNGDLTAHLWNPEVADRIKRRAFDKPCLVLAIDGNNPQPQSTVFSLDQSSVNFSTWASLPARPLELNKTNTVYLLNADTNDNLTPTISRNAVSTESPDPNLVQDYIQRSNNMHLLSGAVEGVIRPVSFLGIMLGASEVKKRIFPEVSRSLYGMGRINRRQFLKGVALIGGASLLSLSPGISIGARELASKAGEDFWKKLWLKVDQITAAKLFMLDWVDARTGLMYSKMEDIYKVNSKFIFRPETNHTIVIGNGHNSNQAEMERDKKTRNEKVRSYAESMIHDGKQAYAIYADIPPSKVPPEAVNRLLDYFTLAEIVKVTDPGGGDKNPFFINQLNNCFTTITTFHSPQVEEAIRDLRPS